MPRPWISWFQTSLVHAGGADSGENPSSSTGPLRTRDPSKLQQPELPTVGVLTFPTVAGSDVGHLSLKERAFLSLLFTIRYRFPVSHWAALATLSIKIRQTAHLQLEIELAIEKGLSRDSVLRSLDECGVESAARNREALGSRQL